MTLPAPLFLSPRKNVKNVSFRCTAWFSFTPGDEPLGQLDCDGVDMCTSCTYDCVNNATQYNDFMYHIETDPFETVRRKNKAFRSFSYGCLSWYFCFPNCLLDLSLGEW